MDLKKRFDTVNHNCLLQNEIKLLSDYLFGRRQTVFFDGNYSDFKNVTHGVPQGSILGPLLFVLLINDLPCQLKFCRVLMYADDTVLFYSSKSLPEIESYINSDANTIYKWMEENCLILNPKKGKTEFILFSSRKKHESVKIEIDSNIINQPDCYEYLGILLNSHVNLHNHLEKTYKRINLRIKMLKKIRHKISPFVAKTIFNSMIHPLFFYCYPIFGDLSYT